MAFTATSEQTAIIGADLVGQRIVACAGSGKTATAVRRLIDVRKKTDNPRGYVALLSYSNVAIDTFRWEFLELAREIPDLSNRVFIATVDSYITSQILLPHASRTMGCMCQPYLVQGHEQFLSGFKVFNGTFNADISALHVSLSGSGNFEFSVISTHGIRNPIDANVAIKAIHKLGKTGAYTYELGRYWALRILIDQQRLAQILARRFPHILVDEAQDVGTIHGAILTVLQASGSSVSLIGDPNQAIYEFAGANGEFLRGFDPGSDGIQQSLTVNMRSIQPIVNVANGLCGTDHKSARSIPERKHGAFFLKYKSSDLQKIITTFASILKANGYSREESATLSRGKPLVEMLTGGIGENGQGATEYFANAAIHRDRSADIASSFAFALDGVLRLLEKASPTLRQSVLASENEPIAKALRRLVWKFLRSASTGLPAATLNAKADWLPLAKARVAQLLDAIKLECGLKISATWKNNLTSAKLGDGPLWKQDLIGDDKSGIAITTVHKAKGQSIGAVLYIAKPKDVSSLLAGPLTEEGRIGYVAITRACDLFILAIPESTSVDSVAQLQVKGLTLWA